MATFDADWYIWQGNQSW